MQAIVTDYWLGVVLDSYKVAGPGGLLLHGTELEESDQYIVLHWLEHDSWGCGGERNFAKEVKHGDPYVLWQQGAIVPIKIGHVIAGTSKFTMSKGKHQAVKSRLQPIQA